MVPCRLEYYKENQHLGFKIHDVENDFCADFAVASDIFSEHGAQAALGVVEEGAAERSCDAPAFALLGSKGRNKSAVFLNCLLRSMQA